MLVAGVDFLTRLTAISHGIGPHGIQGTSLVHMRDAIFVLRVLNREGE